MPRFQYVWINKMTSKMEKVMTMIEADNRDKADIEFEKKFPKHIQFLRPPFNNMLKTLKVGVRVEELVNTPPAKKSSSGGPPTEGWLMEPARRLE